MKNLKFTLAILIAVIGTPMDLVATASDLDQMKRCAVISNDTARLACFDALIAKAQDATKDVVEEIGKVHSDWVVKTEADPITDNKNVTAILRAQKVSGRSTKVAIVARCADSWSEAYITWGNYLSDNTLVTMRFDEKQATTKSWSPSTDQTATFSPTPVSFMKMLMSHDKFVARITPYREGPTTASFVLDGAKEALGAVAEACNWQP